MPPQISVAQAAQIIGKKERRVRQLVESGVIVGSKLGQRVWSLNRASVERYARKQAA